MSVGSTQWLGSRPARLRSRVLLGVVCWLGLGTLLGVFAETMNHLAGQPVALADGIRVGLTNALLLGILAAVAFGAARRLPITGRCWPLRLLAHLAIAAAAISACVLLNHLILLWATERPLFPLAARFGVRFPNWSLAYALLLGLAHGIPFLRSYREAELRGAEIESQLARAQLQALTMQLHPHFLFNTLNSISALISRAPDEAGRMIGRLEDLLRLTLETTDTHAISLRHELEILRPYLEIEQTRFRDRLQVEWSVAPESLDAIVPHLVLQPLVENAIRHGIARQSKPGTIRIRTERDGLWLRLQIRDTGRGLPAGFQLAAAARRGGAAGAPRGGVGLANTRARLQRLYPAQHRFEIADAPGRGVVVTIEIPFQPADQPTPRPLLQAV
jgi:two-component system, LytTR family, sensor kinase